MFEKDPQARAFGSLCIENKFFLDYLPAARGDYVKVYLWGLFATEHMPPDYSLSDMARDLNMALPEIEAALRYWERRTLVSHISDDPPVYQFHSPTQRQMLPGSPLEVDDEFVNFSESVYAAFGDRRKITPGEIALAWEWVLDIGLKPEVVLMLINHCIARRGVQFSFKKAEPLAVRMKEHEVNSCDDADAFLHHDQAVHDGAKKVLSRMGKRRFPSDDELALYEKWLGEWGFAPEAILDACAETTKGDPSFKYLDGILNGIRARGQARTGEQVKKQLQQEADEKALAQEVFARLGKPVTAPAAIRLYREIVEIQPHGVLLLAADECRRSNKNLEDMQALLISWKNRGLQTEEAVSEYLSRFREANLLLREVFEACGHNGRPTAADRTLYEKWKNAGMNQELILAAAEQARAAEGSKIAYLDKVLEAWHEAGITDISQARAQRRPDHAPQGKTVSAQRYAQREYTEEELLAVSDDLIEEAKKLRG
ncbi:MAG: DnaD domain protein [Clostridia bacterium]|nr:DnaD domain protein [Clostridia bacterium]MBQ6803392.1 DnaD domain protein [Clostridia bacterium]